MEFSLHPSPCARIRHRMSSLDCVPMPRDFRVSILHRERMKRKEERRRIEGKYFSPSSRGKNRRRGMFKGDGFLLSFEERATRAFDQFLARIFANGPRSSSQF